MVRITCQLCGAAFTVHPKQVRPTTRRHDESSHPENERERERVIAEVLLLVPPDEVPGPAETCGECGIKTSGDPSHRPEHARMLELSGEITSLDAHFSYEDLDGPRWPVFPR